MLIDFCFTIFTILFSIQLLQKQAFFPELNQFMSERRREGLNEGKKIIGACERTWKKKKKNEIIKL